MKRNTAIALSFVVLLAATAPAQQKKPDFSQVSGIVINHIPASTGIYVGSPSIIILADGTYLATHDEFGPKSQYHGDAVTRVFRSTDRGQTWKQITKIDGSLWANLFLHRGALYLMGTNREYGDLLIRRSTDGGQTWTTPTDENTGLLAKGRYHCAPDPVVVHNGRIWRAWEQAEAGRKWGENFKAFMLSAPEDADLLKAASWTHSNAIGRDPSWLNGKFGGWLEGNAVVAPDKKIVNILRVDNRPEGETAAIVRISGDGKTATFDPANDFIHFPGGTKKFTIRFDPKTNKYWSLTNYIPPRHVGPTPNSTRNTLALTCSADLRNWDVRTIVLYHPDVARHGFQYVDWQFDGNDLIAACRTAYDDGLGGAHNTHDANFLTFHRVANFRDRAMKDSAPMPDPPQKVRNTIGDLEITGDRYTIATLKDGAPAFSNRTYVWQNVPARFSGAPYTQVGGGERAEITVKATRDTTLYVATSVAQAGALKDFKRLPDTAFAYTDAKKTQMAVFEKPLPAGQSLALPQSNWTGTLVLIPSH